MNIIEACKDPNLFRPFLEDDNGGLGTWFKWFACLRGMYGLPVGPKASNALVQVTKRNPAHFPLEGFNSALFLTGRRSGKSRMAAVIGAYEAALAGNEKRLAKGEKGIVAVIAPTKSQGGIVRNYIRAIFETPILATQLVRETREGFELRNGIEIRIMAGDFRTVRGFTLVAAIVDEIAFFGLDEESKVKSDTELIRAVQPSLATCRGKLIAISSPYAKRGWVYKTHTNHFSNDRGKTLVVNCPSRTLNPTLSEDIVDEAMQEDPASARSEYLGMFRDDIAAFIGRDAVEALVKSGRESLLPRATQSYFAFVDMSGGRSDDHALAIAHMKNRVVVIDFVKRYKPGQSPFTVVGNMAEQMERYGVKRVHGDNYAADWVAKSFQEHNVHFTKADRNKSALYLELLPRLGSGEIELLDNEVLVDQLSNLERRTRSGGKDIIDHAPGCHDDVANAVAGVSCVTSKGKLRVGALRTPKSETTSIEYNRRMLSSLLSET